jgi:hypothetical protein
METRDSHGKYQGGEQLLNKWLTGEITFEEELALFGIADSDPMIREALEGYIGQKHIARGTLPAAVAEQLYPGQERPGPGRMKRLVLLSYAAAALLLFVALTFIFTLERSEGLQAEPFMTEISDTDKPFQYTDPQAASYEEMDDARVGGAEGPEKVREENDDRLQTSIASVDMQDNSNTPEAGTGNAAADQFAGTEVVQPSGQPEEIQLSDAVAMESGNTQREGSLLPDGDSGRSVTDGPESISSASESAAIADAEQPAEARDDEREIALQFFDTEADEVLKREIQLEAIKEGDQPITGYEIDIRSGITPEELAENGTETNEVTGMDNVDQVGLQSKANLADAAGENALAMQNNRIASNVVITEYKIQKRDITHPPIEDYNSLVREKYKRKAKPEVGFYHYKKYLKRATDCLLDVYSDVAYLEEAIIKFRVFRNGNIEFIELFGTDGSNCVESISADITSGPKWQVAERYESIDIEVPFKVLYPYWY